MRFCAKPHGYFFEVFGARRVRLAPEIWKPSQSSMTLRNGIEGKTKNLSSRRPSAPCQAI